MVLSCKVLGIIAIFLTASINNLIYNNFNNNGHNNNNNKKGVLNSTSVLPTVVSIKTNNNTELGNKNETKYETFETNTSKFQSDECGIRDHGPETNFVVHGAEVDPLDWPWLAVLYTLTPEGLSYKCVGSLVSRDKVVTAAHCVTKSVPEHTLVVLSRFNTRLWGANDESVTKEVLDIEIHPSYLDHKIKGADLAVLTLKHKASYNYKIRPVCLFARYKRQPYGDQGTVIGWGRNEHDEFVTAEPSKVDLTIAKPEECIAYNKQFQHIINANKFCAANETEGIGPCQGDSGGGFYVRRKTSDGQEIWSLRGIVSGSLRFQDKDDCLDQKYFTFTDIESQIGWLRDQVIEVKNETLIDEDKKSEEKRQNITEKCIAETTKSKIIYLEDKEYYNSQLYHTDNVLQNLETSTEEQIREFQETHHSTTALGHILKVLTHLKKSNNNMKISLETISKFTKIFPNKNSLNNNLISIIRAEREKGKASLVGRYPLNIEAVKYLINSGADPLFVADFGRNSLHYAVVNERFEVMKYLLENYNFNVNLQDQNGWTALGYAVHSGNKKILKYLINVIHAKCNGYHSIEGYSPLQWAAYSGKFEIVKILVESCNADVNAKSVDGKTALDLAVSEGFNDIIHYLYYITSGDHDIFDTPLHKAVFFSDITEIKRALNKNIDINIRDSRNQTALIWASKSDNLDVFKYLAEVAHANISLYDEHGYTVAHWSAFSGTLNILKYLSDKFNIDLNIKDNENNTPLHWAAGLGHLNIVKYLVREKKVDTFVQNNQGLRAINLANVNYQNKVYDWMQKYETKFLQNNSTVIKPPLLETFVGVVPPTELK